MFFKEVKWHFPIIDASRRLQQVKKKNLKATCEINVDKRLGEVWFMPVTKYRHSLAPATVSTERRVTKFFVNSPKWAMNCHITPNCGCIPHRSIPLHCWGEPLWKHLWGTQGLGWDLIIQNAQELLFGDNLQRARLLLEMELLAGCLHWTVLTLYLHNTSSSTAEDSETTVTRLRVFF